MDSGRANFVKIWVLEKMMMGDDDDEDDIVTILHDFLDSLDFYPSYFGIDVRALRIVAGAADRALRALRRAPSPGPLQRWGTGLPRGRLCDQRLRAWATAGVQGSNVFQPWEMTGGST